ncbi:hypothetical protein L6452_13814 [Arctium lappa]|uniref:Uncharacterized protein n=1 Tax=Arctium lappa TaxID=4217 RepID=A0ACB9CJ89_ARCLA|nr:hypothetical protein L6452_13814 [Arctium lappa]
MIVFVTPCLCMLLSFSLIMVIFMTLINEEEDIMVAHKIFRIRVMEKEEFCPNREDVIDKSEYEDSGNDEDYEKKVGKDNPNKEKETVDWNTDVVVDDSQLVTMEVPEIGKKRVTGSDDFPKFEKQEDIDSTSN